MAELGLTPMAHSAQGQRHILDIFLHATGVESSNFPGTMPVTLSRRHLMMVARNDYVILEKSDGTRYLLFTTSNGVYLVDRRMTFYCIEPNPQVNAPPDFVKPQVNTLLDGELAYNLATETWEYLIYDAVAINGDYNVAQWNYRKRMATAENWVAAPRVFSVLTTGLLRIRIKDYYEKEEIRDLFQHVFKGPKGHYVYVNHDRRDGVVCNMNDGCIFTPAGLPYPVKTCSSLLKWKPPHLNSVDFRLELERTFDPAGRPGVTSYVSYKDGRGTPRLREVRFPSKRRTAFLEEFDKYNGSIVECSYDRKAGEWRYIRRRDDKSTPNYSATVIDTLESIAESIEREELVNFIERATDKHVAKRRKINRPNLVFRDDLFDENNEAYRLTTPMSLVPPPYFPPDRPPHRTQNFGIRKNRTKRQENMREAEDMHRIPPPPHIVNNSYAEDV